jgi:hypothetical protein
MAILRPFLLFLVLAFGFLPQPAAAARGLSEQELKAAALFQVLNFTRWDGDRFETPDTPIRVGIFGQDPFGPVLDELVAGERISGRRIEITRFFSPEEADRHHVVYLGFHDERSATRLLHLVRDARVLTVGDSEVFCERGGVIAVTVRNNRIRIIVNLEVARRSGVALSSKLLRLAHIVEP